MGAGVAGVGAGVAGVGAGVAGVGAGVAGVGAGVGEEVGGGVCASLIKQSSTISSQGKGEPVSGLVALTVTLAQYSASVQRSASPSAV